MMLLKKFIITICISVIIQITVFSTQDKVVLVPDLSQIPVIDGNGNDDCWKNIKWQNIDQMWIPYGINIIEAKDFNGRYKIAWSSKTNLLYFLIEVEDDVFVGGYPDGKGANYDYDIAEIFIDENKSGGVHMVDGIGLNAQNAFAYHIYADFPADGKTTITGKVEDMAGTRSSTFNADYSSHLPEFAMHTSGHVVVREFSLIVYDDTYKESNKNTSRVQLTAGKIMGLTLAICDNDGESENQKVRDNMFGSVAEPNPGNLHWQNADFFGTIKLLPK